MREVSTSIPEKHARKWERSTFACALICLTAPTLAAIALLLLNDHILKPVVPSWLMGKLDDVAGLYFFPFPVLAGLVSLENGRPMVAAVANKADRAMLAMACERAGFLTAQTPQSSRRPVMIRRSFQTSGLTYQPVLPPMWVALLQVDNELGLALVNGQTGKAALGPCASI